MAENRTEETPSIEIIVGGNPPEKRRPVLQKCANILGIFENQFVISA